MATNTPTRRRLSAFPDFVAADQRLSDLKGELAEHDFDVTRRYSALGELTEGKVQQRTREAAAAQMLVGGDSQTLAAQRGDRATIQKALADLLERREIVRTAIQMQEQIVARLRGAASAEICRDLSPAHRAIVSRITEARIALSRASQAEREMLDDLLTEGVSVSLRPMGDTRLGRLDDQHSFMRLHLRECIEHGFDVPELPEVPREELEPARKTRSQPKPSVAKRVQGWIASATA